MALLTQYASFFVSPFGESTVTDELNTFLRSHRIVNVEKKLIDSERGTGWVFIVEYADANGNNISNKTQPKIDYREVLNTEEYALFDKLRDLRKEAADKSGVPVYLVFTNNQLAAMVKNPPKTVSDLGAIEGIGEAKIKQYGEMILSFFLKEEQSVNEKKELSF